MERLLTTKSEVLL